MKETLKEKCTNLIRKISAVKLDNKLQADIAELPPYNQYVASLHSKIKLQSIGYRTMVSLLIAFCAVQQYDKHVLSKKAESRPAYFIPTHIPNILKLRPNTLSDTLVFEFADWFITQLGNINYVAADEKFKTLSKYMSPSLRTRFLREMRPKVELWKMRQVDQQITFDPPNKFDRKTSGRETAFHVSVWVDLRKYVDGREQEPVRERITLEFRTSPVDSEKSWLFEVTDIVRKTPQELEDEQLLQEEVKK